MRAGTFDEVEFFRALEASGVRALLIGRRAMVVLGLPVLTADYDFWISAGDAAAFNAAAKPFDLHPTKSPDEARRSGRYVLENDEHIDVLVARAVAARSGEVVAFDEVWQGRQQILLADDVYVNIPTLDDLIRTKRFALRSKDLEDIRMLEILKTRGRR
ncbi:MAG TPA: hypothetical protein VMO26_26540 [Vicinamibacterales bacterium]|nr:hypothetical protein [Vicinamibacterales bacterium]